MSPGDIAATVTRRCSGHHRPSPTPLVAGAAPPCFSLRVPRRRDADSPPRARNRARSRTLATVAWFVGGVAPVSQRAARQGGRGRVPRPCARSRREARAPAPSRHAPRRAGAGRDQSLPGHGHRAALRFSLQHAWLPRQRGQGAQGAQGHDGLHHFKWILEAWGLWFFSSCWPTTGGLASSQQFHDLVETQKAPTLMKAWDRRKEQGKKSDPSSRRLDLLFWWRTRTCSPRWNGSARTGSGSSSWT